MLRINIFNIKEFWDDGEEKTERKKNENKIVQLLHCFIVGNLISYYQKYYKTDPEKAPEDKKHPKGGNLALAGFE